MRPRTPSWVPAALLVLALGDCSDDDAGSPRAAMESGARPARDGSTGAPRDGGRRPGERSDAASGSGMDAARGPRDADAPEAGRADAAGSAMDGETPQDGTMMDMGVMDGPFVQDAPWTVTRQDYGSSQVVVLSGFGGPYGLLPTADGTLYVADLHAGSVVRFDRRLRATGWLGATKDGEVSGWHLTGSPVRGDRPGMFRQPHSIAIARDGRIWIADYGNGRVHVYEPDGTFVRLFFEPPPAPELAFAGPPSAEFDAAGNLWIADFDGHRVYEFDPALAFVGWVGATAAGPVTDGFAQDGAAAQSSAAGGMFKPHMVAVDDDGFFYVVETGNHRVQKFSPDGHALGWIGAKADGTLTDGWAPAAQSAPSAMPGGFNLPCSLRLFGNAYFLITDNANHRIQKFSLDGHFIGWLGGREDGTTTEGWATSGLSASGTAPGAFNFPYDAYQRDGKLYVGDGHNGRVQIFELPD